MTIRPLLIPYAIDRATGREIPAAEIAGAMDDIRSTIRLQATARADTIARKALLLTCPACGQRVYPRAPVHDGGRYYWSHMPHEGYECPLESKRKLTPDQINALIFRGRQEGDDHKRLVALLVKLAENDPCVDRSSLKIGAYEPPTVEMRSEFPYGRFPDVQFLLGSTQVILEAQLATITLCGINGRRAFYDRKGARLLWVMRNFDPLGRLRASIRDIVADQGGVLFSIDAEIEALSAIDNSFRLRVWHYENKGEGNWSQSIVTIAQAAALAKPIRWSDDFKQRWIEYYRDGFHSRDGLPDPLSMLNEVAQKAGLPNFEKNDAKCILNLLRLLISLEANFVTGAKHPELISLANAFDHYEEGYKAMSLVKKALERWQPTLLTRRSMIEALARAQRKLKETGELEWGRRSSIGRIRDVLFPNWEL